MIVLILSPLAPGGVRVGKQDGGLRSYLRVIIQKQALWKPCASVSFFSFIVLS